MTPATAKVATVFVGRGAGDSGEDVDQHYAGVLRLEGNGGHILGTAVLIRPNWALAIAHCVAACPSQMAVHHLPSQWRAGVTAAKWLGSSVMEHEFPFASAVEPEIRRRQGVDDCLVLLKLDAGGTPPATAATHLGDTVPEDPTLVICGYGKDREGNYPSVYPNFGYLCFKKFDDGRGHYLEHPSHRLAGYPMGDDSGAPVYASSSTGPVVVGLHAARIETVIGGAGVEKSDPDVVFQYLPVTTEILDQIKSTIESSAPQFSSASNGRPVPRADRFTFRGIDCCIRMNDVKELAGTFHLYHAKGSAGFRAGDSVAIKRISANMAQVTYSGPNFGTRVFDATLHRAFGQGTDRCWLEGCTEDCDRFFLLLKRSISGSTKRRVLVEYFKKGSTHPLPHGGVVKDGWSCPTEQPYVPSPRRARELVGAAGVTTSGAIVQNQDDDGRGDE